MRFLVNQKYWSIKDRFSINDEQGRPWFQVEGKIFTLGKKLTLFDMSGNEVFFLKQRLFSPFKKWDLMNNGNAVGLFKAKFFHAPFCRTYYIQSGDTKLKIKGSYWGFNFRIYENDAQVGSISKKILRIADTYVIDIPNDNADPTIFVTAALIVDALHHRKH